GGRTGTMNAPVQFVAFETLLFRGAAVAMQRRHGFPILLRNLCQFLRNLVSFYSRSSTTAPKAKTRHQKRNCKHCQNGRRFRSETGTADASKMDYSNCRRFRQAPLSV